VRFAKLEKNNQPQKKTAVTTSIKWKSPISGMPTPPGKRQALHGIAVKMSKSK